MICIKFREVTDWWA